MLTRCTVLAINYYSGAVPLIEKSYSTTKEESIVNKSELVKAIAEKSDVTKDVAQRVLDATTDVVTEALKAGQTVTLVGFGSFQVRERAAREGRNPKTGEKMNIKASKSPSFKAGKLLKDAVN